MCPLGDPIGARNVVYLGAPPDNRRAGPIDLSGTKMYHAYAHGNLSDGRGKIFRARKLDLGQCHFGLERIEKLYKVCRSIAERDRKGCLR